MLGWIHGTPHGSYAQISLIYKPDSAVGEGEIVSVLMPRGNFWGKTTQPETLRLSDDGLTMYYSYHFSERLVMYEGLPEEYVIHEKGTYSYTTDLNTGETALTIIPD